VASVMAKERRARLAGNTVFRRVKTVGVKLLAGTAGKSKKGAGGDRPKYLLVLLFIVGSKIL
jgi:hypothetical protein